MERHYANLAHTCRCSRCISKGAVDAWAIWDPYYASAQLEDQARVLASGKGLSPNYTFYLAAPNFVKQYPKLFLNLSNKSIKPTNGFKAIKQKRQARLAKVQDLNLQPATYLLNVVHVHQQQLR